MAETEGKRVRSSQAGAITRKLARAARQNVIPGARLGANGAPGVNQPERLDTHARTRSRTAETRAGTSERAYSVHTL